jgi:hypothetical protein
MTLRFRPAATFLLRALLLTTTEEMQKMLLQNKLQ